MKKLIKLLVITLVVLLTGCKGFKEAECTGVKGFKVNKVDTKGINADIMLGIKNPNPVGFSVYRSKFDVMYNGVYLGTAKSSKRVHIDANSEKTYAFTLSSDFKNLNLTDIMKLIGGGNGMVQIKGSLKIGKFYLKKRIPVDVKERASLSSIK